MDVLVVWGLDESHETLVWIYVCVCVCVCTSWTRPGRVFFLSRKVLLSLRADGTLREVPLGGWADGRCEALLGYEQGTVIPLTNAITGWPNLVSRACATWRGQDGGMDGSQGVRVQKRAHSGKTVRPRDRYKRRGKREQKQVNCMGSRYVYEYWSRKGSNERPACQ